MDDDYTFNFVIVHSPIQALQKAIRTKYVYKSAFDVGQAVYATYSITYQQSNLNPRVHLKLIPVMMDASQLIHRESKGDPTLYAITGKRVYGSAHDARRGTDMDKNTSPGFNLTEGARYVPPFIPRVPVPEVRLKEYSKRFETYMNNPMGVIMQSLKAIVDKLCNEEHSMVGFAPCVSNVDGAVHFMKHVTYVPKANKDEINCQQRMEDMVYFGRGVGVPFDGRLFQYELCKSVIKHFPLGCRISDKGEMYVPIYGTVAVVPGIPAPDATLYKHKVVTSMVESDDEASDEEQESLYAIHARRVQASESVSASAVLSKNTSTVAAANVNCSMDTTANDKCESGSSGSSDSSSSEDEDEQLPKWTDFEEELRSAA